MKSLFEGYEWAIHRLYNPVWKDEGERALRKVEESTGRISRLKIMTSHVSPGTSVRLSAGPGAHGVSLLTEPHVPKSGWQTGQKPWNSLEHTCNKSIDRRWKTFWHTVLFPSLKLGILIFYFHQAVGKVCIIDETMFCRVSESLAFPGLLSSQYFTVKRTQKRQSSMIPRSSNSGKIDCRNGFYFHPFHLCRPFILFSALPHFPSAPCWMKLGQEASAKKGCFAEVFPGLLLKGGAVEDIEPHWEQPCAPLGLPPSCLKQSGKEKKKNEEMSNALMKKQSHVNLCVFVTSLLLKEYVLVIAYHLLI